MNNLSYKTVECQFIKGFNATTGNQLIMVNDNLCEIAWKKGNIKGNIYKVLDYVCLNFEGLSETSYLIEEAKSYKQIINKNNLTLNSILTINQAIKCYMAITGACSSGTRYFVENLDKVKSEYSIKEIIDLTKGQFGNQEFQDFFNNINLIIKWYEK